MVQQSVTELNQKIAMDVANLLDGDKEDMPFITIIHNGIATTIAINDPDIYDAIDTFLTTVSTIQE